MLKMVWTYTPLRTRAHCHLSVCMSEAHEVKPLHLTWTHRLLPCHSLTATLKQARATFTLPLVAVIARHLSWVLMRLLTCSPGSGRGELSPRLGWQDRPPHGLLATPAQAAWIEGLCGKIWEA